MIAKAYQSDQEADQSTADDFKVIRGIGASVEDRLHKAGISTYQQLADLTPKEIAKLLRDLVGFTPERIAKQDWIGQARKYASQAETLEPEREISGLQEKQHYAVFSLELLLDEENSVRRTRVMHVQSKNEESWAGWDVGRLQNFFTAQASLHLPARTELISEATLPSHPAVEPELQSPIPEISGQLRLTHLEPQFIGAEAPSRLIPGNKPFNMRLTLDLSGVKAPADRPIRYTASIFAKALGAGSRLAVGSSQGTFKPAKNVVIGVGTNSLLPGTYRIEALVGLSHSEQESQSGFSLIAMAEGGLFQVY